MMNFKYLIFYVLFILLTNANASTNYLLKPSGEYSVGFQDFHWVNKKICPDPNYTEKNKSDFSPENKKFCHEIMVRMYYPSTDRVKFGSPYYKPLIRTMQYELARIPDITKTELHQLDKLQSFSLKNIGSVAAKQFPVIIFSPGYGSSVQMYENFILTLVSHGYIVVGVNSPFISGDIALPNKHVVKFNIKESLDELIQIPSSDLAYVYHKIHTLKKSNPLFANMDLQHIGGLGQSLGGEIIANTAHSHPDWFQAAATLDSGIDVLDDTLKKFKIPFMRQIAANRKTESSIPMVFDLGDHGFLVRISPHENNNDFSYHMNFTDYSTLQYFPAEKKALAYFKTQKEMSFMGTGNGWEITNSINDYLLQFFDTYLKNKSDSSSKKCQLSVVTGIEYAK